MNQLREPFAVAMELTDVPLLELIRSGDNVPHHEIAAAADRMAALILPRLVGRNPRSTEDASPHKTVVVKTLTPELAVWDTHSGWASHAHLEADEELRTHMYDIRKMSTQNAFDAFAPILAGMRRVLRDELAARMPNTSVYLLDHNIEPNQNEYTSRVWSVLGPYGEAVFKEARYRRNVRFGESSSRTDKEMQSGRAEGLNKLYVLPANPYISYQMHESWDGASIEDYIPEFTTAASEALAGRQDSALTLLRDSMLGGQYMIENGLRLTDLKADNIRLSAHSDPTVGRRVGQLFDFDSIQTADHRLTNMFHSDGKYLAPPADWRGNRIPVGLPQRIPPIWEYGAGQKYEDGGYIEEADMVYEFGYTIKDILEMVEDHAAREGNLPGQHTDNPKIQEQLIALQAQMMRIRQSERPSLAEAVTALNRLLEQPQQTDSTVLGRLAKRFGRVFSRRPKQQTN